MGTFPGAHVTLQGPTWQYDRPGVPPRVCLRCIVSFVCPVLLQRTRKWKDPNVPWPRSSDHSGVLGRLDLVPKTPNPSSTVRRRSTRVPTSPVHVTGYLWKCIYARPAEGQGPGSWFFGRTSCHRDTDVDADVGVTAGVDRSQVESRRPSRPEGVGSGSRTGTQDVSVRSSAERRSPVRSEGRSSGVVGGSRCPTTRQVSGGAGSFLPVMVLETRALHRKSHQWFPVPGETDPDLSARGALTEMITERPGGEALHPDDLRPSHGRPLFLFSPGQVPPRPRGSCLTQDPTVEREGGEGSRRVGSSTHPGWVGRVGQEGSRPGSEPETRGLRTPGSGAHVDDGTPRV